MFAKFTSVLVLALAGLSLAAPSGDDYSSKCNGGNVQCCNTVQNANDYGVEKAAGLVGIAVSAVSGQVGFNCDPITAGAALGMGSKCNSQTVCCGHFNSAALVAVNCSPINIL